MGGASSTTGTDPISPGSRITDGTKAAVGPDLVAGAFPSLEVPEGQPYSGGNQAQVPGGRAVVCVQPEVEMRVQLALNGIFRRPIPRTELHRQLRLLPPPGGRAVMVYVASLDQACALRWLRESRYLRPFVAIAGDTLSRDGVRILRECAWIVVTSGPPARGRAPWGSTSGDGKLAPADVARRSPGAVRG